MAADSTPAVVTAPPEPSPLPTLAPTIAPTSPPTVLPEVPTPESSPVLTVAVPTAVPSPPPTPVRETVGTVRRTPTVRPIVTATPAVATPVTIPWPSPAELRQNARLRWGRGIPASVRRWAFLIVPAARQYALDPNLVAAVMTLESNGDPRALSPAGARGLMQILHGPWDPAENVAMGVHMLADLYARFGDWRLALAAYNAGPGAVIATGGVPLIRETRDYVIVVQYLWDLYGRRHLSVSRGAEYRRTLRDLARFKDQPKKMAKLARIGQSRPVRSLALDSCALGACLPAPQPTVSTSVDPFWPLSGAPDPLQAVGPVTAGRAASAIPDPKPSSTSRSVRSQRLGGGIR